MSKWMAMGVCVARNQIHQLPPHITFHFKDNKNTLRQSSYQRRDILKVLSIFACFLNFVKVESFIIVFLHNDQDNTYTHKVFALALLYAWRRKYFIDILTCLLRLCRKRKPLEATSISTRCSVWEIAARRNDLKVKISRVQRTITQQNPTLPVLY